MTSPETAGNRLLAGLLLGCLLGICHGFLRPLRRKGNALGDLLFLPAMGFAWLEQGFRVCGGDLRLGYFFPLFAGAVLWEMTVGRLLRPAFSGFWKAFAVIFYFLTFPVKKFLKFAKILFASGEKWVTIKWNNRRQNRRRPGGTFHGSAKEIRWKNSTDHSSQQPPAEDRGDRSYRVLYGGTDLFELGSPEHPDQN